MGFDDVLEVIKQELKRIAKAKAKALMKKGLSVLAPYLGILFIIIAAMLGANALSDAVKGWLYGPQITQENIDYWANYPELLLHAMKMERFDPNDFGWFYLTEDDLKTLLEEVVEYRKKCCRNRDGTRINLQDPSGSGETGIVVYSGKSATTTYFTYRLHKYIVDNYRYAPFQADGTRAEGEIITKEQFEATQVEGATMPHEGADVNDYVHLPSCVYDGYYYTNELNDDVFVYGDVMEVTQINEEGDEINGGGNVEAHLGTVDYLPMEAQDDYTMHWQEVYVFLAMKSLSLNAEDWVDNMEVVESDGGKNVKTKPVSRIHPGDISTITAALGYSFAYHFDPTADAYTGLSSPTLAYTDMENYAYVFKHIDTGGPCYEHDDCSSATEDFTCYKVKIPAPAPAYATNAFTTYEWEYDENGDMLYRVEHTKPNDFMRFGSDFVGKNNWDMSLFNDLLASLPGTSERMEYYEEIYSAYLKHENQIINTKDDLLGCKNYDGGNFHVHLGSNLTRVTYTPSDSTHTYDSPFGYDAVGEADRPLDESDDLTVEQIQQLLDYIDVTPGSTPRSKPGAARALYDFQEEYKAKSQPVSVIGFIGTMYMESGKGIPFVTNRDVRKNYTGQKVINALGMAVWMDNSAMSDYDAMYANIEKWTQLWVHRDKYKAGQVQQNSYQKFQTANPAHVYCTDGNAAIYATRCASYRKELELKLGIVHAYTSDGTEFVPTPGATNGEAVVEYAMTFVGRLRYVYGGSSLVTGTDCSGFTMRIFEHFGVSLPHSSSAQRTCGVRVASLADALPGDLICYSGHVAIYIGDGKIVHNSTRTKPVHTGTATYRDIVAIRRVIFD